MKLTLTEGVGGYSVERQPAADRATAWVHSFALRSVAISVLMLVPCFWQPRIEAGDLASHIYNTWLVQLVEQGKAPGLWISHKQTNVIFDYALSLLSSQFGFVQAQKIGVSLSVLLFFWSAFTFVSVFAGKRPWFLVPCLGMLTYGVIFSIGSFNYYIALALSFFALACLLKPTPTRVAAALALLALSWLGQPLPALWVVCTIGYISIAKKLSPRYRMLQFIASLVLLIGLRLFLLHYFIALWSPRQILYVTGADQVVTFGQPYRWIFLALLGLWAVSIVRVVKARGLRSFPCSIPVQLYALCAIGAFLLPNSIWFPGYAAFYSDIPQRFSLIAGVLACVVISEVKPTRLQVGLFSLVTVCFFGLMCRDAVAMNRLESKIESVVSQLPPNARVIGRFYYPATHGMDISMILDRACIEKCFSYGNYEPSTQQFRVRANVGNTIVAPVQKVPFQAQYSSDSGAGPLHEIYACGLQAVDLCVRRL